MFPRHQLAGYSPITAGSVFSAALGAIGVSENALEHLLSTEYTADHVILTSSGTHALQLAIMTALAAEKQNARIVALPAFGCFDLATAAIGSAARVLFYDLDPRTLAPDWASFEAALNNGARAAVVVPFYGVPVDWEPAEYAAKKFGAVLIEDAAQGHGAVWRGNPIGSLGRLSVLSFNRGKGWTGGSGGALLCRGGIVLGRPNRGPGNWKNAAMLLAQWALARPAIYGVPRSLPFLGLGETHFVEPTPVSTMTLSARRAVMANVEASRSEVAVRRKNAHYYLDRLSASATPVRPPREAEGGFLRLPILVRGGVNALSSRAAAVGIAPSYPKTLPTLSALNPMMHRGGFPGADQLVAELVTLPTHSRMRRSEIDEVLLLCSRSRP